MELSELQRRVVESNLNKNENVLYAGLDLISNVGKLSKLLQSILANQGKEISNNDMEQLNMLLENILLGFLLMCDKFKVDVNEIENRLLSKINLE